MRPVRGDCHAGRHDQGRPLRRTRRLRAAPFVTFSPDVTAETFEVVRQGDSLEEHGCSRHPPHGAVVSYAYQSVRVNGEPIAVVGATVSCPSGTVGTGRPTVKVGEGAILTFGR
ncbi:MAG: hypothetical protein U0359_22795 [Byssovorax sp.]